MSEEGWIWLIIFGLGCVTIVTRSFFLFSDQAWQLPRWAQRGLQYAPLAALSAVVAPEVVMSHGQLIETWQDARWVAVIVGVIVYFMSRHVLLTIIAGMLIYLPLHIGFGW
jgi:branched-subunit amino acid transport protein